MHSLSDEEVMLGYKRGEVEAMDELLRRYKTPVYRFVWRICTNATEAEDIAQEVFLKIHEFRGEYQVRGKFSTWIFSIAHNLSISRLRRRRLFGLWPRKPDDPDAEVEFRSPDPSPKEIAGCNEVAVILAKHVQSLPFLQREALILREYQDMDYAEIAKILKKSLGTVKTLIRRARMNLKNKLLPCLEELKGGLHE